MIKRLCGHPGCGNPTDGFYCEEHRKKEPKPFYKNAARFNARLYNTAEWRRLRKRVLEKRPRCAACGAEGTAGLELHHTTPPKGDEELFFSEGNVTPLCKACHAKITNKERRKRPNR